MNDKFGEYNLYHFAYCGTDESFMRKLENLAYMAEYEIWGFDESNPLSILKNYIYRTFERTNAQHKVLVSNDGEYACSNTGLLTPFGKDILMYFGRNLKGGVSPWYFRDFKVYTDREVMNHFSSVPPLATYADDYDQLYFKPDHHIEVNFDHILDDNWERIHKELPFDKAVVRTLLFGAIEDSKLRVRRNLRLAVPQFYKNEIMFLLPVKIPISDEKQVTMALAIEETEQKQYRANTIFTREMAYEKARLLMKPDSNWLIE